MHSNALLLTALGVMFCSGCTTEQQTPTAKEDTVDATSVKAQLEKLGAAVAVNEQGEIVGVNLTSTKITDAGLVHLQGLTSLQELILRNTQITDAGLVHLEGLTSLGWLHLYNTKITDAGLVHLQGLTSLQELYLSGTKITDVGLVYLQGLTSLQELILRNTQITDAGVAKLKEALPNCEISH